MARWKTKEDKRRRRHYRIRNKISGTMERPRLAVYRSLNHITAQVIDDVTGRTLASASTTLKDMQSRLKAAKGKVEKSRIIGELIAERAKAAGVTRVSFDRGGYLYHGRVQALAVGARKGGLEF
jgi:large subunit ribosomal protein L18